jgi:hypothetical protein
MRPPCWPVLTVTACAARPGTEGGRPLPPPRARHGPTLGSPCARCGGRPRQRPAQAGPLAAGPPPGVPQRPPRRNVRHAATSATPQRLGRSRPVGRCGVAPLRMLRIFPGSPRERAGGPVPSIRPEVPQLGSVATSYPSRANLITRALPMEGLWIDRSRYPSDSMRILNLTYVRSPVDI